MKFALKFNKLNEKNGINGKTWQLFEIRDEQPYLFAEQDHFDMYLPTYTANHMFGLGFSVVMDHAKYLVKFDEITGKEFGVVVPEQAEDAFYNNNVEEMERMKYQSNHILANKYHVASQRKMEGNTWRNYNDPKNDLNNTTYVDHIDVHAWSWTGENTYKIGFSQIYEGEMEIIKKDIVTGKGILENRDTLQIYPVDVV